MGGSLYVPPLIYAASMVSDYLIHGFSTVVSISPNSNRGAGWAFECDRRRVRLWMFHLERAERFLVKIDSSFLSLSSAFWLAEGVVNRFSKMIAALQKRFTEKNTKTHSEQQHKIAIDRRGAARLEGERVMTRRGETRR